MQQQEPHELMPVRQSPGKAAQDGQEVLMDPQRDPPFRQDPKTRERMDSMTADGPVWGKQSGQWLLPRDWVKLGKSHWLDTCEWVHSSVNTASFLVPLRAEQKMSRKFYFQKNRPPLQGAKPGSQRKSHLPRQWLWWFHTKLVTKAGKSHQSAAEIYVRSFTRHIQHSVRSVVTQGLPWNTSPSLITPFQASALTEYFHGQSQWVPALNTRVATDLEGEWFSTASPRGSSSLPSHACSQQYSLPALRMRQEVCALLTQGQSRCPTVTTAPSSWEGFTLLNAGCWSIPHALTVCPELHPVPSRESPLNKLHASRQLPASSQGCTDSGLLHLSGLPRWPRNSLMKHPQTEWIIPPTAANTSHNPGNIQPSHL